MKAAQTPLEMAHAILLRGKDPKNIAWADFKEGEGDGTQQVPHHPPCGRERCPFFPLSSPPRKKLNQALMD